MPVCAACHAAHLQHILACPGKLTLWLPLLANQLAPGQLRLRFEYRVSILLPAAARLGEEQLHTCGRRLGTWLIMMTHSGPD